MSRNPAFDKYLAELREAVSLPLPAYGDIPQVVSANMASVITADILRTYEVKDQDYASNGKPMGNLRASENLGIPPWKAVLLRMNDKISRIQSFISRGKFEVDDEKITDTLIDLSVYAILGRILFEEEHDNHAVSENFEQISQLTLVAKILYDHRLDFKVPDWNGATWNSALTRFRNIAQYARDYN